eukprot:TRINITY_DN20655_c0_g1_i1.p1 TRINITY_DN20655_c0_g1~~TRINITY_DN20655_c0_g1_i1.p1  ORF type:complete len:843 (-),score=183.29 TRINITY_DN20655_c0_g1_i1:99-2627(-)
MAQPYTMMPGPMSPYSAVPGGARPTQAPGANLFEAIDANHDGVLDRNEWARAQAIAQGFKGASLAAPGSFTAAPGSLTVAPGSFAATPAVGSRAAGGVAAPPIQQRPYPQQAVFNSCGSRNVALPLGMAGRAASPLAQHPGGMPVKTAPPSSLAAPPAAPAGFHTPGGVAPLRTQQTPLRRSHPTLPAAPGMIVQPCIQGTSSGVPSQEEYQHLLGLVMAQERTKQELASRLEKTEQEMERHRAENDELRQAVKQLSQRTWGMLKSGPPSVSSRGQMESVIEGIDSEGRSVVGSRSRSLSARRTPKTPVSPGVIVPYALAKESLPEKYFVDWDACLHVGTLNGLQSGEMVTLSRFFKAKAKANGGQRIVKAVLKKQVPFQRLMEQHIADQRVLQHPHICQLYDAFEDDLHVHQIFEFLSGPSLVEKVLSDPGFCERDAAAAVKAMSQAIAYLHGCFIAHQNVHLDNMRFATQPRKKETGSAYGDQLKLMDLGLSLNKTQLPIILNAASAPSSKQQIPLLLPLGFRKSIGEAFLPPECKGVCSSYAQLAAAAPCMLQSSRSTERLQHSSSASQLGFSAGFTSRSSMSSFTQDSSTRRAKDLLLLLQAGDIWALGCCMHILLCGQAPEVNAIDSPRAKAQSPKLPLLDGVASSAAQELCSSLLCPQAKQRATADCVVDDSWFSKCEAIQRAHRSQRLANGITWSLTAPRPPEFWEHLGRTVAASQLQHLYHSIAAVKASSSGEGSQSLQLPGPVQDMQEESSSGRKAADAMCSQAFELLVSVSGSREGEGLPLHQLTTMLLHTNTLTSGDLTSGLKQFREPETSCSPDMITGPHFANIVWTTCG